MPLTPIGSAPIAQIAAVSRSALLAGTPEDARPLLAFADRLAETGAPTTKTGCGDRPRGFVRSCNTIPAAERAVVELASAMACRPVGWRLPAPATSDGNAA